MDRIARREVARALWLVAVVWGSVRIAHALSSSLLVAFGVATLLATAVRHGARLERRDVAPSVFALAAGCALHPGVVARTGTLAAPDLVAVVLLAPAFEEILYRERLLRALTRAVGRTPAVVASSAVFAVSHLDPRAALPAFAAGLALGALRLVSRSVAPCIGCHAGLNLAAAAPVPALACIVAAVALCVGVGPTARAAELPWQGTIALEFPSSSFPSPRITGAGVATVNGSSGGVHLTTLRVAGGIGGTVTVPITDPEISASFKSIRASLHLGTGTLHPFGASAPPTAPQLTQRTLPVGGLAEICVLTTDCLGAIPLPLSTSGGHVGLGIGGTLTAGGAGVFRVSVVAAPWTLRTATHAITTPSGTVVVGVAGWRHGAASFTTSTAVTGGALSIVTPARIVSNTGVDAPLFGRLTLRFVPEPGRAWLVVAGLAFLVLLAVKRTRSPESRHDLPYELEGRCPPRARPRNTRPRCRL